MVHPEGSEPPRDSLTPSGGGTRRWGGWWVVLAVAGALAVGLLVGSGLRHSRSSTDAMLPDPLSLSSTSLPAPTSSSTPPVSTSPALPSATASSTAASTLRRGRLLLGVQTSSGLSVFDGNGTEVSHLGDVRDSAEWYLGVVGRRPGEVFYRFVDGTRQTVHLERQVFFGGLPPVPTMTATLRPVVVAPIRPANGGPDDVVLARRSFDNSDWGDIPVPGCGVPHPFATWWTEEALGVWCTASRTLRIFEGTPPRQVMTLGGLPVGVDGVPAIAAGGRVVVLVGADGTFWTVDLGGPSVRGGSPAPLRYGEQVAPIAAAAGDTSYIGVATADDVASGRVQASSLVVYRTPHGPQTIFDLPRPIESIAVASDGRVYAYSPGAGPLSDAELLTIDPDTGATAIVAGGLDLGHGRLLVLSP